MYAIVLHKTSHDSINTVFKNQLI